VKNRLHLDIEGTTSRPRSSASGALGGSLERRPQEEYGWRFVIVADPEGTEFCLIHGV
jgi:Glyoxalase-like domain